MIYYKLPADSAFMAIQDASPGRPTDCLLQPFIDLGPSSSGTRVVFCAAPPFLYEDEALDEEVVGMVEDAVVVRPM